MSREAKSKYKARHSRAIHMLYATVACYLALLGECPHSDTLRAVRLLFALTSNDDVAFNGRGVLFLE